MFILFLLLEMDSFNLYFNPASLFTIPAVNF